MNNLPPGLLLILGSGLACLLPRGWRSLAWCALPLVSLIHMLVFVPEGTVTHWTVLDLSLIPIRADRLSAVWGVIFHIAAWLGALYGLHRRDRLELTMGLMYAGAAIASVYAGDLLTLFLFWELTAITSVFLVWAGRSIRGYYAGMRYLLIQVASGVLLLAGAIFQLGDHHSLAFGDLNQVGVFRAQWGDTASLLLLLAFGIKAAFPLLHAWLKDAYPEASPSGTVFLSVFTTKLAIYTLVRGFAGLEVLIGIGCVMAIVPLFYALLEDDVRRALAYCLNNQLGFMVVAAGVGSELAINGAAAHAVAHILYKGLLFMATGAVLYRTGTAKASQLGGLAAQMPVTFACYLVGILAISAPPFCGFVTKTMSMAAVAETHHLGAWISLLLATAGVFLVCGLRITADVFLGGPRESSGDSATEHPVPWNMQVAMLVTAAGCLLLGLFPGVLYRRLPYAVDYHPYAFSHVAESLQLVVFAGLAFLTLVALRMYPFYVVGELLDVDWFYRRALPAILHWTGRHYQAIQRYFRPTTARLGWAIWDWLGLQLADDGRRGRFTPTGRMAMAAAVMLVIYLLLYYR